MESNDNFATKFSEKIGRFLSSLSGSKYNVFKAFEFTTDAKKALEKYYEKLEMLKDRMTADEYAELMSNIEEHIYVALREKTKKTEKRTKDVTKKMVISVIDELGDPDEMAEFYGEGKGITMKTESFWIKVLKFCWALVKWFIAFLLFVGIYLPLFVSALSVVISGIATIIVWAINPSNFFGFPVRMAGTLGWLTPVLSGGLVLIGVAFCFLIINIVGKIHWNKAPIKGAAFIVMPMILGVFLIGGSAVGYLVLNRANAQEEVYETLDLGEDSTLVIEETFGDVQIIGKDDLDGNVEIKIEKYAAGYTERDAEKNLNNIDVSLRRENGNLSLSGNLNQTGRTMYHFERAKTKIYVPMDVKIEFSEEVDEEFNLYWGFSDLYSIHDGITLKNLTSDIDIDSSTRSLKFENISNSEFKVKYEFGSLDLLNIKTGEMSLDGKSGSVDMENVSSENNVTVMSDYGSIELKEIETEELRVKAKSGSIDMEKVSADVHINSKYGSIEMLDVNGDAILDAQHGSIDIAKMRGNLDIHAGYGSIEVTDIVGELKVDSSSGSIDVSDIRGSVGIESEYGSVEVDFSGVTPGSENYVIASSGSVDIVLPKESDPIVNISSSAGSVENDFKGNMGDENSPVFEIDVDYGSLEVKSR